MSSNQQIQVEVNVRIKEEYSWENSGEARIAFSGPLQTVEQLDFTQLLSGLVECGFKDYLRKQKEIEENKDEE